MPLGGTNILWNEAAPADTDSAGAGAAEIRSDKTSIRNAMGSEHFWPSGGGAGVGVHLLGSARPFYDVQSNVSSSGTDGRLLVTSDSSRLFHVGSAGTMFLGGQTSLSAGSQPVGGQRFYWAVEFGAATMDVGSTVVTFPNSGFSGIPFVQASVNTKYTAGSIAVPLIDNLTATTMVLRAVLPASGNIVSNSATTVFWLSIGTRTF